MSRQEIEGSASVCLDGAVLKRLREEKRLTQLYVSKVVGVTTDTVSRWENNRYPSMRRENALKLAEALEVPVEELLRESAEEASSAPPQPVGRRLWLIAGIGLLIVVIVGLLVIQLRRQERSGAVAAIVAERVLPRHAAPGAGIPVQVRLDRQDPEQGFILRENLPKGWKLLQSSPPPSSLDNDKGVARWIVKVGDLRESIVYLVEVGSVGGGGGDPVFRGEIVAATGSSQQAVPVGGDERMIIKPIHWADQNGDGRIDDGEMLQASYTVDEMVGVHIDWLELERLWSAGGYRWDAGRDRFVPAAPPPAQTNP
jgi:transcriptional regulator with XRE-family HTH domain